MHLRDYQIEMLDSIHRAWAQGAKHVCAQMSTGAGKTVVFCEELATHIGAAVAIAHRVELVSQISLNLARRGLYHNIIASKNSIREIISIHVSDVGQSYYSPRAKLTVAGVDTLIRNCNESWAQTISLVVIDEAHHVLRKNKWGKAIELFPNARGLFPTATPMRADGFGLGRHADGIIDVMVQGPSMRSLIAQGYLSDYRIFCPPSDLDLSTVSISAGGDYSPEPLRNAVHKSHITGDVVKHYLKIAPSKLGVTFAVDIQSAEEITLAFKDSGVPCEMITGKTPDGYRAHIMRRFRNREILQIVNVDILGEGVDVPAIEVVSMARPTQSFALYSQAFGRALRPLEGKEHAIIIDHVGNVLRHGLPDAARTWSLDRRERRRHSVSSDPIKNCLECYAIISRLARECPFCGHYTPPQSRSAPEFVDGDLTELDPDVLSKMRGKIDTLDRPVHPPNHLGRAAQLAIVRRHRERYEQQLKLRAVVASWAGIYHDQGWEDFKIYRKFFHTFGIDIMTAQTLNQKDAAELEKKVLECNPL